MLRLCFHPISLLTIPESDDKLMARKPHYDCYELLDYVISYSCFLIQYVECHKYEECNISPLSQAPKTNKNTR